MTKRPWMQLLAEAVEKMRMPLAYVLVVGAFALRFTPWSDAIPVTLVALGLLLLPVLFEIHKKVVSTREATIFESFDSATNILASEIDRITEKHTRHTLRYLGIALVYWQHLEPCLSRLLKRSRVPPMDVQIVMLDPNWGGLDSLNPAWKSQISASAEWVENFIFVNKAAIEANRWSVTVHYYRGTPHLWGILIDDSTLFATTARWENGRLHGSHNPAELFRKNDDRLGDARIREFLGWFETHWNQSLGNAVPNP